MVDPLADKTNSAKNKASVKLFSAEQLKEALRFVPDSILSHIYLDIQPFHQPTHYDGCSLDFIVSYLSNLI